LHTNRIVSKDRIRQHRLFARCVTPDNDCCPDTGLGGDKGVVRPRHCRGSGAGRRGGATIDVSAIEVALIASQEVVDQIHGGSAEIERPAAVDRRVAVEPVAFEL